MLFVVLFAACSGTIGEAPAEPTAAEPGARAAPGGGPGLGLGDVPAAPPGTLAPPRAGDPWNPGASSLRRLTRFEYVNSVRTLLQGDDAGTGNIIPSDEPGSGYDTDTDILIVADLHAEKFFVAAEAIAQAAVTKIDRLAPCDPAAMGGETCARALLKGFGKRVYRRPLTTDESERLAGIYRAGAAGASHPEGLRWMLKTMFLSPAFLYHVERGVPIAGEKRVLRLSPYEVASRLSYLVLGGPPDDALMQAADAGLLGTSDLVARQARRLLAGPQPAAGVQHFFDEWLEVDNVVGDLGVKVASLAKTFDALRSSLRTEASTFATRTFLDDGKIETLLAAPYSYVDAKLASFYGVTPPAPTGFARANLDASQRAGILTQGAFLAGHAHPDSSSPVLRGKFVRERVLCGAPLSPPPNVNANPPAFDPAKSSRQQITEVTGVAGCRECPQLINEPGFAMEHFDAVGKWRTVDGATPVDASGAMVEFPELAGRFDGAVDLARRIARSAQLRSCFVQQLYRYAVGRRVQDSDEETLAWLRRMLDDAQHDMRELAVALAASPPQQFRLVDAGGAP